MTTRPSQEEPELQIVDSIAFNPRNFWAWVAYQFFYRIGWQFKMEATLMAGLISFVAPGSPVIMGIFTAINTLGRNLSPLAAAPIVDRFRSKRGALLMFWAATTFCWIVLTIFLWTPAAASPGRTIWVFGFAYTLFFVFLGAVSVAQGTLLGKIIPAHYRGRALAYGMALSGFINVGAVLAVYAAIRHGGFPEPRTYALAFTLTCAFFIAAGFCLLWIEEPEGEPIHRGFALIANLRIFVSLAKGNPNLYRLILVNIAVGIGGSMLQFYTGFWRLAGTMTAQNLMLATVTQVFWQSLASGVFGRMADRVGNRILICWLLWIEALVPIAALYLGGLGTWYWYLGVYTLIGIRFPVYQLLVNYLLEIVPQRDHAMAIGAVTTVQLLTAPAPILLGWLARVWGYPSAFVLAAFCVSCGAVISQKMQEVRVTAGG
jgi:MFS family permease